MTTAREHFALDWIKSDLLETLNDARVALDEYAEQGREESRLRPCLTALHQAHGTLVMLELKGVTQLADHLEQLVQAMLAGSVDDTGAAGQALMQGILELPGYLDELQRGAEDSFSTAMPLVNEIRALLNQDALVDPAGASLHDGATAEAIARFNAIDGANKVGRIRSAYQSVLLSILKGEDRSNAVVTLGKIAMGLEKVCEGTPLQRQWQAFGEFVASLKSSTGALEADAVKLLRRVDLEIRHLAKQGDAALQRPVNTDLLQHLLEGALERDNQSAKVAELREAVSRDVQNSPRAISARQDLASDAEAIKEDLAIIKDKLDLLVRAGDVNLEALRGLIAPLNQIGSTLSLLGFESSREIVSDQVDAIERLVMMGDSDPQSVQSVAGALVQIDENLSSVVLGSGATEVERITSDAELQVLREARKDLEHVKQCIVDFVTAHWSVGHLESVPETLAKVSGALEIIPLSSAITQLDRIKTYISGQLMQGRRPEWEELDRFADAVSALDYYLERLGGDSSSGAEDILAVAQRGLDELEESLSATTLTQVPPPLDTVVEQDAAIDAVLKEVSAVDLVSQDSQTSEPAPAEGAAELIEQTAAEAPAEQPQEAPVAADATGEAHAAEEMDFVAAPETAELSLIEDEWIAPDAVPEELPAQEAFLDSTHADADEVLEGGEPNALSDAADAREPAEAPESASVDEENFPELVEPRLEFEADTGFDLSGDEFDELVETAANDESAQTGIEPPDSQHAGETEQAQTGAEAAEPVTDHAQVAVLAAKLVPDDAIEPPDDEIVEIFVEEVDEVLANIAEYLPQWVADFGNTDALAEVRRAFHTLKGSGRIVQALAIGELAWGVENMLNRIIDGTVEANDQFVAAIDAARALVPDLRDAFAHGQMGDLEQVALIIEQADVLASGGEIERALAVKELPGAALPEVEAQPDQQTLPASAESAETSVDAYPDDADSLDTAELFIEEALEHLQVIRQENQRNPWTLSEALRRAFHTLNGGAALTELAEVQLIVAPAYQVVEAYDNAEPSDQLRQFFVEAAQHLGECLAALQSKQEWEEPLEFVAHADDLLALRGSAARTIEALLQATATDDIFAAETTFNEYLLAAEQGQPRDSADLCATLAELAGLAEKINCAALVELSESLRITLIRADQAPYISAGETSVLRGAYHQVIDQLNQIAAGGTPRAQPQLVSSLHALQFEADAEAEAELTGDLQPQIEKTTADTVDSARQAPPHEEPPTATAVPQDALLDLAELKEVDADLVEVFFEEAEEINEELEASILGWSEERENRLYMETLLRSLHTLKGGARLCGLSSLGEMAHDFESYVIEAQNHERAVDDALFTELNRRYDEITHRLSLFKSNLSNLPQPLADDSARDNIVALNQPEARAGTPPLSDVSAGEVSDVNKVVEAVVAPANVDAAAEPESSQTAAKSARPGPAAADRNNQEMVRVGSALLEELVNLAGESSILRARIEQGMSDFTGALDEMETTIERLREQLRRLEIETETQILHRHERTDGPQYENFDPLEMDRYSQLQQLSRGLSESASDMLDLKETLLFKARESETLLLQQARINTELQEGLMRTRMVPFSRLMPRLRRIVRQVSGELGKKVELHFQNAEGELDRNLLERMVPPLEHMLRNAVDHGIESAELRTHYGKTPTGRIDLRLTREGGDVVIEISDDGAGVDVEGVRAKALERGLMTEDADLSDEEVLQFVLASGFSTAKLVTQISGRGVGLDVVHSEVKQLGGSISIASRPGKGTRFVIRVPFTVSVNRALMVSVGDDLYALPLNTIEGIVLLSPEQLQALNESEGKTFEYAGVPYRVRYLGQYLGREYHGVASGQSSVPMVLVRSGDLAVAIHVDHVQGSREIVVKSLGPQFAGVGGISGATILGDGSVVVILDLLALIRAQHHERARSASTIPARSGPRCVMVVDDSVTVRKVTSRLLERQGMDVLVAKDGIEAVALLQERRPDIMLLDIEMPRMDGFEVARQVRHDERLGELPIVMISSRTGDKHKEHASQLGVNKFLGKPFQENELLATIDELVGRH